MELSITASLSLIVAAGMHDAATEDRLLALLLAACGQLQAGLANEV